MRGWVEGWRDHGLSFSPAPPAPHDIHSTPPHPIDGRQADGYGVMVWTMGTRYEGLWECNKRCGHGIYYYLDGSVYHGDWCVRCCVLASGHALPCSCLPLSPSLCMCMFTSTYTHTPPTTLP